MKRRNVFRAGLVLTVLLCELFTVNTQAVFSDVPENAWYAEAVNWCREHGIVNDEPEFFPQSVMTRAMVATALYRASGSPEISTLPKFTDVSNDTAIAWAAETGVITGYEDGTFKPDNPVTRQQFAAMLWRSAGCPPATSQTSYADETSISAYAKTAVNWAKNTGVILGKDDNLFDPHGGATRAQAAVILYRSLTRNVPESQSITNVPESQFTTKVPESQSTDETPLESGKQESVSMEWPEISPDGVNETLLFSQIDTAVLENIARELQTLVQEEREAERQNPSIVLTEGWTRVFRSERYQKVLDMGQNAVKPLYWIIYKSPNAGLYEYICATALYELSGYDFTDENGFTWSTSKELLERMNERILADRELP